MQKEPPVAEVEIYSSMFCPFCHRAKRLLSEKGVAFREIDVDMDAGLRKQMMERANGRHTVPQIFIDGTHVGGSDDLAALDRDGELDRMLGLA
jgi:glutaredoxin 3